MLLHYSLIRILFCLIIAVFCLSGLELVKAAIAKAGYEGSIEIGMDVAASEFCKDGKYDLDFKNDKSSPANYVRAIHTTTHFKLLPFRLFNFCIPPYLADVGEAA